MFLHLHSSYNPPDLEGRARHALAARTWATLPWTELPVADSDLPRLFSEGTRHLPYLRDLFDTGASKQPDDTILVFTNSDACMSAGACPRIAAALQTNDAGYGFRRDFYHDFNKPIPDTDIHKGIHYPGCDLFFFRVGWWRAYRDQYPDLVFAREAWDACLRVLMEQTNTSKPLAVPDLYYHRRHANGWENLAIRYTLPGQRHNLRLAYGWLVLHGLSPSSFAIRLP